MKRLKNAVIVISALFFFYGCAEVLLIGAGAGLGIGSYKYIDGRLSVDYPLEYDRAWNAMNRTLENFQISITSSTSESGKGEIAAVRKDGKKVSIKISDQGNKITNVSVRVGTFGSREEARKIHDEMIAVAGI